MMDLEGWKKVIEAKMPETVVSTADRFGAPEVGVKAAVLPEIVRALKGDPAAALDMLVDLVSVDYSVYPGWDGPRFGLLYHLKSLILGHRVTLKVLLDKDHPGIGTISHLYKNADWLEREAWDQMGIRFADHPNLKRLLNHHEFVGHPLRKDYPITKRQWLTTTDPMLDQMEARLGKTGWH
jgi:NADH-quinone oxidoreductase subunit C